ncbi:hypothetical protein LINPERHAP1_LOCUS34602 [Linum perenne]
MMESLPEVFVGTIDDLKRIARTLSDAARKLLKSRELSLPPWRKNRYMINKWLEPYRSTLNLAPDRSFPTTIGQVLGLTTEQRVDYDRGKEYYLLIN